jgi:hypothetical protein
MGWFGKPMCSVNSFVGWRLRGAVREMSVPLEKPGSREGGYPPGLPPRADLETGKPGSLPSPASWRTAFPAKLAQDWT